MSFVYMIKNNVGELYIGVTENPEQRLRYHNEKRGAQFTKHAVNTSVEKDVFKIVFLEKYETLAEARHREIQLKRWRREKKEMLIERHKKGFETKFQK